MRHIRPAMRYVHNGGVLIQHAGGYRASFNETPLGTFRSFKSACLAIDCYRLRIVRRPVFVPHEELVARLRQHAQNGGGVCSTG